MNPEKTPATALARLGVAAAFFIATSSYAQPTVLDTVVVTASRLEQRVADAIPHTTVITEREIRASGKVDLPSLLRGLAGLEFTQTGGIGTASTVFMRGAEGRQTLVLIDGVRVESATLGTAAIEHVMLDQVERIEIVRGNVSALYGSAAVGGVIQIFTNQGRGAPRLSMTGEVGSHEARRLAAGVRGAAGETRFNLSASHFRTDGISAVDPALLPLANPDRDGYRNTSVSGSVGRRLSAAHEVGANFYHSQGRTEFDNPFGAPTDTHVGESRTTMGAVMWNARWLEPWRARLQLARTRHESHASVNRAAPRRFDTDSTQIDWRNELALTAEQTLLLGLHSLQQKVDSTVAYARTQRRTNSATVGYNAHFGRHQWQANVRHDDISDIGGATTYLIGAGINMTETVRLTATRSTAFNAPTFNQLFFPGFGNPNLRPERARSSEVGVQYAADTVLARVVWFRTRYTDLIVFAPPTFAPLNVARAQVEGVELSASAELAGVRLRVSATDQRPINEDTGETLRRRAHRFGSLSAEREFAAWRLGVHVVSVGPRPDGAVTLGSYTLLHVNAGRRLANDLWLTVRVTNATDERYSTAFGYNAPRREGFIGLAWRQ